jgi:hypothetical protein
MSNERKVRWLYDVYKALNVKWAVVHDMMRDADFKGVARLRRLLASIV